MMSIRFVLIMMVLTVVAVYSQHLIGDHVCKHEEKYKITIEKNFKKNATIREYVWCMSVPPRCSKYRRVERDEFRVVEEDRTKIIYKCCEGYEEDSTRTYCIPICEECVHGVCENPNSCVCNAGFSGESCNETCAQGLWGRNCSFQCNCEHGNFCDAETGYCNCDENWTGLRCEIPITTEKSIATDKISIQNTDESVDKNYLNSFKKKIANSISLEDAITTSTMKQESTSHNIFSHLQMNINNKPENIVVDRERISTPSDTDFLEKSKKNFDIIGKTHQSSVKSTEQWQINDIQIEDKNPYSTSNYYYLMICLGVGLILVLIIISVMSIMIARYKKQRNLAIKHSGIQINPSHASKIRLSTQPIIERSIFHAPLPDPPVFKNPVFTIKDDKNFNGIPSGAESIKCNNHSCFLAESTYDYPPSSGSFRRASIIPDPSSEPVYDEIPSWRRPRPVTCPNSSSNTEINPYRYSCCETTSKCEWGAVNL